MSIVGLSLNAASWALVEHVALVSSARFPCAFELLVERRGPADCCGGGGGRLGEDEARRDRGQPTHLVHVRRLPHIPRVQILVERLGMGDCSGGKCMGVRRRKSLESVFGSNLHILYMSSPFDTSHRPRSALKAVQPLNMALKSIPFARPID